MNQVKISGDDENLTLKSERSGNDVNVKATNLLIQTFSFLLGSIFNFQVVLRMNTRTQRAKQMMGI